MDMKGMIALAKEYSSVDKSFFDKLEKDGLLSKRGKLLFAILNI